ncbi:MAG: DUF4346 domain-containing protein [Pseudomonadota bacterium]
MDLLLGKTRSAIEPVSITSIPAAEFDADSWPLQPGNYSVLNPRSFIAVLLVGESISMASLFCSAFPSLAVTGTLTTENIGVEYVVKNLISNPFIRHLAIIGRDVAGHRPADAIIKLSANGLDAAQRIIAANGARPVLRNLLKSEVDQFRKQITVHNLMDHTDTNLLQKKIHSLDFLPHQPYEAGLRVQLVETMEAKPAKRLYLDPAGYFIILANRGGENPLRVEHYKNNGTLAHIIEGKDATTICSSLIQQNLVSRLDHAAYLGRELVRAENAIKTGTGYVQDRAPGEINCG